MIQNFNGFPVLAIYPKKKDGSNDVSAYPLFSFGKRKAELILEHQKEIEEFLGKKNFHEQKPPVKTILRKRNQLDLENLIAEDLILTPPKSSQPTELQYGGDVSSFLKRSNKKGER